MNKKNTYIYISLILLCIAAISSFDLFSSYLPAEKRGPGYLGPRRTRQKPKKRVIQAQQPAQAQQQIPTPVATPITIDQTNQNIQQPTAEPTITSDAMQAKAAKQPSSPGWLTTTYIVLLSTLNKAFGGGIAASNKNLVKSFIARQAFLNLKNDAQSQAQQMVDSGDFDKDIRSTIETIEELDISPADPQYTQKIKKQAEILQDLNYKIKLPSQQKIATLTKDILKEQKIDVEKNEKATAFSSILKQGVYVGMLNTIIPMMGSLIGLGATMLLQSLMPTQDQ